MFPDCLVEMADSGMNRTETEKGLIYGFYAALGKVWKKSAAGKPAIRPPGPASLDSRRK
jgi:hypothetical protein